MTSNQLSLIETESTEHHSWPIYGVPIAHPELAFFGNAATWETQVSYTGLAGTSYYWNAKSVGQRPRFFLGFQKVLTDSDYAGNPYRYLSIQRKTSIGLSGQ